MTQKYLYCLVASQFSRIYQELYATFKCPILRTAIGLLPAHLISEQLKKKKITPHLSH